MLVDINVGYTKLYDHREKADTIVLKVLKISNETFRLFLDMLLLSGCHELPDHKIHWETSPDTFVKATSDSMSRLNKVFFEISVTATTNILINKNNSQSFVR